MKNPENQLAHEISPYLLQHACNPVNWHAWNTAALEQAKKENKPILLSIGYSACHWCHVMAHESFEDECTARIMNAHFINIKVDREERPDLDRIYQTAHSILTGRPGGWPLTVFLDPNDQIPFFAGTYFPKEQHYGMPSFCELLLNIHEIFQTRLDEIIQQNNSLMDILDSEHEINDSGSTLNAMPLDMARHQLLSAFDSKNGGFSRAPKFPHPAMIERALRHWCLTRTRTNNDQSISEIFFLNLQKMAMSGLFDHIGGGFFRYSTDDYWMIPHFEKMLYDNGQLLPLYVYAWQISGNELFSHTINLTASWVIREMQSPQGGYYSSQDADSEGVEGQFYVWTRNEIHQQLNADDYKIFARCFGLDQAANFEHRWHLHRYLTDAELANELSRTENEIDESLSRSCKKLFMARALRNMAGTDDKILASWNGLMIRGMCLAYRATANDQYLESACKAMNFVSHNLWCDNKLLASGKQDNAHLNYYLDDYACMLLATLEYLQCRWDNNFLDWAIRIADAILDDFEDKNHGGFYFTRHDHEKLIQRSKIFSDDSMPSGNGIASLAMQRLGLLTGNTKYLSAVERCLYAASGRMNQQAVLHCSMLNTLEEYLNPPVIIILRGDTDKTGIWQQAINQYYLPRTLCFVIPSGIILDKSLADKKPVNDACAYICEGTRCLPAVTTLEELINHIRSGNPHTETP
ncbi:MAG: uncharacterized protein QG652_1336 [Pseudomonadota bacterium]|nr:uncharacterized protein [Pseudomonadota bacterium]